MTLHPSLRLAIPALLFAVLVAAPRQGPVAGADAGPAPLVAAEQEPPPDIPLAELYYEMAEGNPAVTVVEFSDFGCQYCGQFHRLTLPEIRRDYVATGKVRWRIVPFVLGMFPNGLEAMRAAGCVAEQGPELFWTMHDTLFARQDQWKSSRQADQLFRSYAVVSGADGATFSACYDDARSADRATAANALANRSGVRSTPTFFVNGQLVQGALPAGEFRKILDAALQ